MCPPPNPKPINFPDEPFEEILRRIAQVPAPDGGEKKEDKTGKKEEKNPPKPKK